MPRQSYALTVLIVDDYPDAAMSLARLVGRLGHEAVMAYSPREAILAVDADAPDAVVLDIGLPGLDGYALARKICDRLTRRPLLVAVTGQDGLEERSAAEGFDRHLRKPADPAEVAALLSAHARRLAGGSGPP